MPALQLSQVCTVTPTAAQHTHEHVATNPGSWRNLRHRKGSRKQAAPGPRNPPHARSFALLRPPPQANQALPVQQHASVLPASEFHTNGIILHIDWFLVSDFFHSVFFQGWRWGEIHRVLHVVVDYSYCYIVGKFIM